MSEKTLIFLGAGFSKAITETAPMGNEILKKAFSSNYAHDKNIQHVLGFIKRVYYLKDQVYPNIQDVLSLLDSLVEEKENLSNQYSYKDLFLIRQKILDLISKIISDSTDKSMANGQQFIEKICLDDSVSVITTNYDTVFEDMYYSAEGLYPDYGFEWRMPISRVGQGSVIEGKRPAQYLKNHYSSSDHYLIKLHGSLNWFHCPKCDEIDIEFMGNLPEDKKQRIKLEWSHDKLQCVNDMCTAFYEPVLIPPSFLNKDYRNRVVSSLFELARTKLEEAERIIFIGYGLNPEDYHIKNLLTLALANRDQVKLSVFLKEESKEQELIKKNRYLSLFGSRINEENFNFSGLEGFLKEF